jgi:hypothetical protein
MIPDIDIWRAASLTLKRYGDKAPEESTARPDELFTEQDDDGGARVAPSHRRGRPARQSDAGRTATLIVGRAGALLSIYSQAGEVSASFTTPSTDRRL